MSKKIRVEFEFDEEDLLEIVRELSDGKRTLSPAKLKQLSEQGTVKASDFIADEMQASVITKAAAKLVSKVTPKVSKATSTVADKVTSRESVKTVVNTTVVDTVVTTVSDRVSGAEEEKPKPRRAPPKRKK